MNERTLVWLNLLVSNPSVEWFIWLIDSFIHWRRVAQSTAQGHHRAFSRMGNREYSWATFFMLCSQQERRRNKIKARRPHHHLPAAKRASWFHSCQTMVAHHVLHLSIDIHLSDTAGDVSYLPLRRVCHRASGVYTEFPHEQCTAWQMSVGWLAFRETWSLLRPKGHHILFSHPSGRAR